MSRQEFSDSFDTLLNSYANQSNLGDEASKFEIVLDEYEKSVLLTQAQDIILKSFFDRKQNSAGDGFDDSAKRQIDFSSLITTASLTQAEDQNAIYDDRGIIYKMPLKKYPTLATGVESQMDVQQGSSRLQLRNIISTPDTYIIFKVNIVESIDPLEIASYAPEIIDEGNKVYITCNVPQNIQFSSYWNKFLISSGTYYVSDLENYLASFNGSEGNCIWPSLDPSNFELGKMFELEVPSANSEVWEEKNNTTDVLFILNEKLETSTKGEDSTIKKNYVVVPINYREYDREMTKAYAQPLKKQAWRLFQNSTQGFDIQSELIPRWDLTENETIEDYKIRYIRRPCPIVLVDLPDGLEIDGFTRAQDCELNPILHTEILQKAIELAIATRGGVNRTNNQGNGGNA